MGKDFTGGINNFGVVAPYITQPVANQSEDKILGKDIPPREKNNGLKSKPEKAKPTKQQRKAPEEVKTARISIAVSEDVLQQIKGKVLERRKNQYSYSIGEYIRELIEKDIKK